MTVRSFAKRDLLTIGDALDIAEDSIGNYFKLSNQQWKQIPYEIKTLESLTHDEITSAAFALLNKGFKSQDDYPWAHERQYVYFICLQDHLILKALKRDKGLSLLPLLVYVFTHELVHIVRFSKFVQRFDAMGQNREKEESLVHAKTFEILNKVSLPNLDYVLEAYRVHGICETRLI
jgi:hypothetical protein